MAGQLLLVAAAAIGAALLVRHSCLDPGPPVDRPESGTSRAGYCGAISGSAPWAVTVVLPLGVAAAVSYACRRHPRVGWGCAFGLVGPCLANAVVAGSLTFAYTV